jgi:hypothetical protein
MSHNVFANGRNIASKAADGKSIASFPDVCFTPAPPPPGVPIPYPNTALASDTANGSKTVKIGGQPVMLRDQSYFQTSTGDEAGSAPKKGIATGKIKGKAYFVSWSANVKIEGKNVCRHLDLMTHNHGSEPGNTVTWPYMDRMMMAAGTGGACDKAGRKVDKACEDKVTADGRVECPPAPAGAPEKKREWKSAQWDKYADDIEKDKCQRAARCMLTPYSPPRCCEPQTRHHVITDASFHTSDGGLVKGAGKYSYNKAPCMCLEGVNEYQGTHGKAHAAHRKFGKKWTEGAIEHTLAEHIDLCVKALTTKRSGVARGCDAKCLKEQIKAAYQVPGREVGLDVKLRHAPSGKAKGNTTGLLTKIATKSRSKHQ